MLPALTLLAYGAAAFGWGTLVIAFIAPGAPLRPARTIAFGLVALVPVGALLNAAHLARPFALDALVVIGWMATLAALYRMRAPLRAAFAAPHRAGLLGDLAGYILPLAILIFLSATILPGASLNIFDDFSSYLGWPVRQLQTGSLAGSYLDGTGAAALGSQAFFQSFIARWFSYDYLPAFDSVFCCVVATALVAEIAQDLGAARIVRVLAGAVFIIVNPAIVNLTSVYSGALVLLGLVAATMLLIEVPHERRRAVLVGACCAALVVFKPTFLAVTLGYVLALVLLSWRSRDVKIASWANIVWAALGATLVLLPWLAIYMPENVATLWSFAGIDTKVPAFTGTAGLLPDEWPRLWSGAAYFYGGTFTAYAVAIASLVLAALAAFFWVRQPGAVAVLALTSGAVAIAGLISMIASSFVTDFNSVLRFGSPVIAVGLALATIWLGLLTRAAWIAAGAVLPALTCLLFAQNFANRIKGAIEVKSLIAFAAARSDNYRLFLRNALAPDYRTWIAGLQARVPENEKILAWTPVSFLMDYQRNPILVFAPQAFTHPWLNFPAPTSQPAETTQALKQLGVRYIMWEYAGFTNQTDANYLQEANSRFLGLRRINYSMVRMQVYLRNMASKTRPVFADSRVAIFDVEAIRD